MAVPNNITCDFSDKTLEGELGEEQIVRCLEPTNLSESKSCESVSACLVIVIILAAYCLVCNGEAS